MRSLPVCLPTQPTIRVGPGLRPWSHETAYSVGRHGALPRTILTAPVDRLTQARISPALGPAEPPCPAKASDADPSRSSASVAGPANRLQNTMLRLFPAEPIGLLRPDRNSAAHSGGRRFVSSVVRDAVRARDVLRRAQLKTGGCRARPLPHRGAEAQAGSPRDRGMAIATSTRPTRLASTRWSTSPPPTGNRLLERQVLGLLATQGRDPRSGHRRQPGNDRRPELGTAVRALDTVDTASRHAAVPRAPVGPRLLERRRPQHAVQPFRH
jgi:hypothetical protein